MNTPRRQQAAPVRRFARDVLRGAVVDVTAKALSAAGLALLAAFALLVIEGGTVPAWTLAATLLVAFAFLFLSHRQTRRLRRDLASRDERINELEPYEHQVPELNATIEELDSTAQRFDVYTNHVAETLDQLQRVVTGDLNVDIPTYIERGILSPARDVLAPAGEAIRLSVLLPVDDDFVMSWAAGHSLPGRQKFRKPIKDMLSRLALETGKTYTWDDVEGDNRWEPNPKASAPTRAMVSIPLRQAENVVGVFNAIAAEPGAFDPTEKRYLESLGSIISVAVSVWLEQEQEQEQD